MEDKDAAELFEEFEEIFGDDDKELELEEEIFEEDKERNLFSGVKSTLSWTQLEKTLEEISVTCRFSLNTFAKEIHFFGQAHF